jgi:hypothetical protein
MVCISLQKYLRFWESEEGKMKFRKDAVRGRVLAGKLLKMMEDAAENRDKHSEAEKRQRWEVEYPVLLKRVLQMEVLVKAMDEGRLVESVELEVYREFYGDIARRSEEEYNESLADRDRAFAWMNEDEDERMIRGVGMEELLGELSEEMGKEWEAELEEKERKKGLFKRGTFSDGNDGYHGENIEREKREVRMRQVIVDDVWRAKDRGVPKEYLEAQVNGGRGSGRYLLRRCMSFILEKTGRVERSILGNGAGKTKARMRGMGTRLKKTLAKGKDLSRITERQSRWVEHMWSGQYQKA